MNYDILLDVATELGYRLAMCGAETFRIEDSISRVFTAYGLEGEAFAIPNCLTVSMETPDGRSFTRMRRIGFHGNDLEGVETYSNLSRKICSEKPMPEEAMLWFDDTEKSIRTYKVPLYMLGNFLGAFGFCILFGGNLVDSLCAGLCGLLVGACNYFMDKLKANLFFRTISASFLMAMLAYAFSGIGFAKNYDAVIIGALMILVPGLLFTNALRDIIYGDTNSGINRIVQVFLIAAAIALGTGTAWSLSNQIWTLSQACVSIPHSLWFECIACVIACSGFIILFNIHGFGIFLCALGGMLTWVLYSLILDFGGNDIAAYFFATVFAATYAEAMARIRKYPTLSYLVISAFPLIPGAGVYYTMTHVVKGDMIGFSNTGLHTLAVAGAMAVGILLASTIFRFTLQIRHKGIR